MAIDPQQIELSDEQKQSLARLAEETGRPWSEVLTEALSSLRAPMKSCANGHESSGSLYEALLRDGLVGISKAGPADLSTNPKYMEGFGRDHETSAD